MEGRPVVGPTRTFATRLLLLDLRFAHDPGPLLHFGLEERRVVGRGGRPRVQPLRNEALLDLRGSPARPPWRLLSRSTMGRGAGRREQSIRGVFVSGHARLRERRHLGGASRRAAAGYPARAGAPPSCGSAGAKSRDTEIWLPATAVTRARCLCTARARGSCPATSAGSPLRDASRSPARPTRR